VEAKNTIDIGEITDQNEIIINNFKKFLKLKITVFADLLHWSQRIGLNWQKFQYFTAYERSFPLP
jgi:hypothetical protein